MVIFMVSCQELIENSEIQKAHVVLLGAGASKAVFQENDESKNPLPVMNNLVDKIGLSSFLKKNGIDSIGNFETIYSQLQDNNVKAELENRIFGYFSKLVLPDTVTIYDQLLLSLREKDAIFTFNWDPLLFDAYERNRYVVSLPQIYFLHGNVRIGACESCDRWGLKSLLCPICNIKFKDVQLLYPIEKKSYFESNRYTKNSWISANNLFSNALTVTIFGYGAPASDHEAVELLKKAWFQTSDRQFEHVEIIDILCEKHLYTRWKSFAPTKHISMHKNFENSQLWRWPRRSCEAIFHSTTKGEPCDDFPLPVTKDLKELQDAISKIAGFEMAV